MLEIRVGKKGTSDLKNDKQVQHTDQSWKRPCWSIERMIFSVICAKTRHSCRRLHHGDSPQIYSKAVTCWCAFLGKVVVLAYEDTDFPEEIKRMNYKPTVFKLIKQYSQLDWFQKYRFKTMHGHPSDSRWPWWHQPHSPSPVLGFCLE